MSGAWELLSETVRTLIPICFDVPDSGTDRVYWNIEQSNLLTLLRRRSIKRGPLNLLNRAPFDAFKRLIALKEQTTSSTRASRISSCHLVKRRFRLAFSPLLGLLTVKLSIALDARSARAARCRSEGADFVLFTVRSSSTRRRMASERSSFTPWRASICPIEQAGNYRSAIEWYLCPATYPDDDADAPARQRNRFVERAPDSRETRLASAAGCRRSDWSRGIARWWAAWLML
jgi:hypothetical protein